MSIVKLAAQIRYWDRFNLSHLLKVLEAKYQSNLTQNK